MGVGTKQCAAESVVIFFLYSFLIVRYDRFGSTTFECCKGRRKFWWPIKTLLSMKFAIEEEAESVNTHSILRNTYVSSSDSLKQ